MSNADMFVEMIRLAEQFGEAVTAHMYENDYLTIEGRTKDGKDFSLNLMIKEDNKNA